MSNNQIGVLIMDKDDWLLPERGYGEADGSGNCNTGMGHGYGFADGIISSDSSNGMGLGPGGLRYVKSIDIG